MPGRRMSRRTTSGVALLSVSSAASPVAAATVLNFLDILTASSPERSWSSSTMSTVCCCAGACSIRFIVSRLPVLRCRKCYGRCGAPTVRKKCNFPAVPFDYGLRDKEAQAGAIGRHAHGFGPAEETLKYVGLLCGQTVDTRI